MNDSSRHDSPGNEQPPPTSAMHAVGRRFMRFLGEEGSPLTGIWLIICVFNLGVAAVAAAIQHRSGVPPFNFEMLQDPAAMRQLSRQANNVNLLGLLNYPLTILAMAMYNSGFRPMRIIEKRGPDSLSFAELRQEMFSNFGTTALVSFVYMLLGGLGLMCCVLPGLIAMVVFLPAPYIAAAMGFGVNASLSESSHWIKRHWLLLFVAVLVNILSAGFIVAVQFFAAPAFMGMFGNMGILIANGAAWLLGSIVGYFGWMFSGSVYITIDLAEERIGGW